MRRIFEKQASFALTAEQLAGMSDDYLQQRQEGGVFKVGPRRASVLPSLHAGCIREGSVVYVHLFTFTGDAQIPVRCPAVGAVFRSRHAPDD